MASTSTDGRKLKEEDDNGGERSWPKRGRNAAFPELAPSASTSASTLSQKPYYDVFINHRGPDVKHKLATDIYNALKKNNVTAFLDSKEFELGDCLPTTLEAVIRSASVHIAIFSKNYASSPWCLEELCYMLRSGAKIIPVFYYHVEPADLRYVEQDARHQKRIYVDAFEKYKEEGKFSREKLQEWKTALSDASYKIGEIIQNDNDEKRFLDKIVNIALKVANNVPLVVADHPVGLEKIEKDFEMNILKSAHGDRAVQIVGIWGMGGSGKTTLAQHLYNKKSSSVERPVFVFAVRDDDAKGVLHNKQIQLLKGLGVKEEDLKFDNIEHGKAFLKRHLRSVKVLIVLDDVDHVDQLRALLPVKDSLENGSLIIVTSRDNDVLKAHGITSVYKMRPLHPIYAKELFCQHAFKQSLPLDGFEKLVDRFLKACNGLPLSLKVFGGHLYMDSDKGNWEALLDKILRILNADIKLKLKISYDALDDEEKEMFLDTACFFIGEEKNLAIEVWNGSGWSGLYSWQKLYNKCLVELDINNHIIMHDHLRDLGREIAKNEHSSYRLWLPQQIINAEKPTEKKTGFRGIITAPSIAWRLDDSLGLETLKTFLRTRTSRSVSAFRSVSADEERDEELMANTIGSLTSSLRGPNIFVISQDYYNKVICEVSRELVWLRWFEFHQRSLPPRLSLKNLRVLELYEEDYREHHLEELWMADSDAPVQLRELVISGCNKFQRFPNSIRCLNELKKIVIRKANSLTSLPEEFGCLRSLEHLQLCECSQLSSLPTSFGHLRKLQFLDLYYCSKLKTLPVSFKNLMLLQSLSLYQCKKLILRPEDFQNIRKLEYANFGGCKQLQELPCHITNQASLRELTLYGTDSLRELPIDIGQLSMLQKMSIGSELLTTLPTSLGNLSSLTNLSINHCSNLKSLPTALGNLSSLTNLSIHMCSNLESLPTTLGNLSSLTNLVKLERLIIVDCPMLAELPSFARSTSLREFTLSGDNRIQKIEGFEYCTRLESLTVQTGWEPMDTAIEPCIQRIQKCLDEKLHCCPRLETLFLVNSHLTEIEALPMAVKSIELASCRMLKNIRSTCDLVNLEVFKIKSCPMLAELPSFACSTSLREFELEGCNGVQKIEGLECCTSLVSLRVETYSDVSVIESLEDMEKLEWVKLMAKKGSAFEACIQTIKKCPYYEIEICTRAVPEASSLVDSWLSQNLVVDSFSNHKLGSWPKLKMRHSKGDELYMLCFVINCVTPQMELKMYRYLGMETVAKVEKGRWAWVGVFTLDYEEDEEKIEIKEEIIQVGLEEESEIEEETEEDEDEIEADGEEESEIEEETEEDEDEIEADGEEESEIEEIEEDEDNIDFKENEMERGLVVRGKKQRVMEAFHSLLPLLQSR